MGTSGGSYPSRICRKERGHRIDDDVIKPPSDILSDLRTSFSGGDSLLSQSSSSSFSGLFDNQEYNNIVNNPQRFDFDKESMEAHSEIVQFFIKQGIYYHVSSEYAKFKAILLGIKFLDCLHKTENPKKCLYQIVAKELIKGTLEKVSDNLSVSVTNILWDSVEDEFMEKGISPENIRPIRQAFQYSMQRSIDSVLEKGSDKSIDISYRYIEDFLTDTDARFHFKDASTNLKRYKSASLRRGHTFHNGEFNSVSQMNKYRTDLSKCIRKNNSELTSNISGHKEKILDGTYNFKRDYLTDVKNEEVRQIAPEETIITESKYDLKKNTNQVRTAKEYRITPDGEKKETDLKEFKGLFKDKQVPTILKDLLTIADYLHYFDISVKRNTKTRKEQKYVLRIYTPLVEFWNRPEIKYNLKRAVYELMEENIIFRFIKKDEPVVLMPQKINDKYVISLFSGGLDSLSGAVNTLNAKENPLFVSIRKPTNLKEIQEGLLKELSKRFDRELQGVEYVYKYGGDGTVGSKDRYYHPTQRSRSFLYLTIALICAVGRGSRKILIHENGIISVLDDVPFIQSEIFTRTAHPDFIRAYNRFVESIIGGKFIIENPFVSFTKTGIIDKIIENTDAEFAVKIVNMTESCSNTGNRWGGLNSRYCGACTPCVLKTLALKASRINDKRLKQPQVDIFKMKEISDNKLDDLKDRRANKMAFQGELTLRDTYYLAGKIRVLPKEVVSKEFPILGDRRMYALIKRFSDELLSIKLDPKKYKTFTMLQEKVVS